MSNKRRKKRMSKSAPKGPELPRFIKQFHNDAVKGAADGFYGHRVVFYVTDWDRKEYPDLKDIDKVWLIYGEKLKEDDE
jgi:hypothetical protein